MVGSGSEVDVVVEPPAILFEVSRHLRRPFHPDAGYRDQYRRVFPPKGSWVPRSSAAAPSFRSGSDKTLKVRLRADVKRG